MLPSLCARAHRRVPDQSSRRAAAVEACRKTASLGARAGRTKLDGKTGRLPLTSHAVMSCEVNSRRQRRHSGRGPKWGFYAPHKRSTDPPEPGLGYPVYPPIAYSIGGGLIYWTPTGMCTKIMGVQQLAAC